MPDITTLRNTYFVNSADEDLPSEPVPATYGSCLITPLIDPDSFFSEFGWAIGRTTGRSEAESEEDVCFIYLANWSLGLGGANPFTLDGVSGNNRLIDVLIAKARAGVDVRVLPWVSTTVMCGVTGTIAQLLGGSGVRGIRNHNLMTLESVRLLREEPQLLYNACLNINHHPNGSAHLKMAIVYDGATCVGFTGGLDFIQSRYGWRDVQAKIEGPVVQDLYDYFREIWNELISRRPIEFDVGGNVIYSHLQGEGADDRPPTVLARDFSSTPSVVGTHHVQSLRTVPLNPAILRAPMLPTAPQGIFNVRTALRKAIRAAQTYIYMEDQYFWSREIMSWINEAVRTHPNLKVILLSHGFGTYAQYAIVNYLFHNPHPNLPDLNPSERARIAIFRLARAPDGTTYPCADYNIVHSKTTLIDDQWAIIGSANCTQRSLYTDFEHAISMLDECDSLVRQYRIDLWYEYFCGTEIEDLQQALNAWDCDTFLPTHLVRYSPQEDASLSALDATRYEYADADSRSWRSWL